MFWSMTDMARLRKKRSRVSGCMRIFSALLVLFAATMWSGTALANCSAQSPINITVDSGATYTIDLTADHNDCAPFGITMSDPVTTAHGTVTHNNFAGSGNVQIYYANNGDGATSDTFTFDDGTGYIVTVNVTINPAPVSISITPSTAPDGTVGVAYSQAFTASGGTGPYTYAITAGSLPAGLTLSSNGTLTGTPTEAGSFNYTVTATDANNATGSQTVTMTVDAPTVTVDPASGAIANPQVGVPYSQQFTASGGTQGSGYTFTATGTVPSGLSLSSSGLLSGTPTAATSSASFTVYATDQSTGTGAPFSGSQSYTVSVSDPTLTISPASGTTLAAATQNSSYSQQFTASGGTPGYTYQVTGGTLPNGLSLSGGGQLSGTPTQAGTFNFSVTATDSSTGTGSPFSVSGSYTLDVQSIVPVANPVSDTVPYGSSSNVVPTSFSGGTPTSVAIVSPASHGTATASGTTITYTPISGYTGTDSFTYTGTNSAGTSTTPATVSITVSGPTLAITSSSGGTSLTAQVGQPFTQTFTFSGGKAPYSGYSITGIPAGLSVTGFNNTSITIAGTPTASGTFTLGVSGTDSSTGTDPSSGKNAPFTVNQAFTLSISAASMNVTPSSLPSASVGGAYSQPITASGGIAPYTYAVTSGALPAGMTLSASGLLSGTPTAGGSFTFQVTATDSSTGTGSPATKSVSYTLVVNASTVTVSPTSLPSAQRGSAYSQNLSASGGTSPYSYAVTAGTLPAGLSLSANGALSGTPTTSGTFNFTVTATDSSSGTGPYTGGQAYALTVASPTITVTPATLPAPAVGAAYSQTFSASGGAGPYTYAVTSGTLPTGLSLSSSGALSGTPTSGGSFTFTVTATDSSGAGGPYTGARTYTTSVSTPTITVTPATLPAGQQGTAYSQSLAASGGTAPYTYALASGALPSGLSLSSSGALSGTPTVNGSFNFTITATDSSTGSGPYTSDKAYTLSVSANPPTAHDDKASTSSKQTVTIAVTDNDTGDISSIALSGGPSHGTATVNGLSVKYTPTDTFFGTDTFTYTATGPGGTSTPATVTVTVAALAVPTAKNQSVTVLGGKSVDIDATAGATGGPYTTAAVASAPDTGTATVSGTKITYAAPASASGAHTFTYTLSNAYGTSKPATVSVHINPLPQAVDLSADAMAGAEVTVNLTDKASGGPFKSANLVSISPSTAGSGRITRVDGGYQLQFTSSSTYAGTVAVVYTLKNAYATSARATVTIHVTTRPDPSKDSEVLGLLNAQTESTRRFARGQMDNFNRRLEALHDAGHLDRFSNSLSFTSASSRMLNEPRLTYSGLRPMSDLQRRYLVQPANADETPVESGGAYDPNAMHFWIDGAMNFGAQKPGASVDGIDFNTSGISLGADKRLWSSFVFGAGVGYGHDSSDVGHQGSRSKGDAYSVALYASYQPGEAIYLDALTGYQWLSFDARRYVTADGNLVQGRRDGKQAFGALTLGYEYAGHDGLQVSPYGRLDVASGTLDAYTETGDDLYALHYERQDVDTTTGTAGVRLRRSFKRNFGILAPMLRIEYRHDFQGNSSALLRYADLPVGPVYRVQPGSQSHDHTILGLGLETQTTRGTSFRIEYQSQFDSASKHNQSIDLDLQFPFD
ncbi:putative Ig domain-containing protein [Oleiagrimonas sp. C23AA]|uniref:putative Ig domain-containing protein n=1 Tax=Oleiagrimonas sp. C23AA TaxID=2719047 RepID=UPI00141E33C3|nr:putative Ig domain-containing protein [Oleiagrimonas sp. C23AA]NII11066.1 autotransporter domain-containing protein [Oleiagrimonas sp. C23AA]